MKKAVWWVTGIVFFGQMLFAMANNAQGVLLTSFIDAFSLESGVQGLPNAAGHAGFIISMLVAVPIAVRVGKQGLYAVGLCMMSAMLLLAGAAPTSILLIASYLLMGFGFGCVDTCASSIVADLHQGDNAKRLMGFLHAVYGLGGIIAPLLITAGMAVGATWRIVLFALGGLAGMAFIAALIIFSRARNKMPRTVSAPEKLTIAALKAFIAQPGNVLLVLCPMLYSGHQCAIYLWINRIIAVGYGRVALGAAALSLFWVGTVLSRLIAPMLKTSVIRYLRYSMLLATLALLIGINIGSPVALCVSAALCGALGGAALPMSLTEISQRNPSHSMLSITAVFLVSSLTAIVCGPLIGFIVGKTSLLAGLVVSNIFAAGCAICACFLREKPTGAGDGVGAAK